MIVIRCSSANWANADAPSRCTPGGVWVWREGQPWLVGMVIQETAQGAARLRYVEAVLLNLSKDWEREGLRSLAVMRFGDDVEWPAIRTLIEETAQPPLAARDRV